MEAGDACGVWNGYVEEVSKDSLLAKFLLLCNEVVSHSGLFLFPSNLVL